MYASKGKLKIGGEGSGCSVTKITYLMQCTELKIKWPKESAYFEQSVCSYRLPHDLVVMSWVQSTLLRLGNLVKIGTAVAFPKSTCEKVNSYFMLKFFKIELNRHPTHYVRCVRLQI